MYKFIDMHCDSLLSAILGRSLYDCAENMLDVRRMIQAGQGAQFFAVFFPPRMPEGFVPPPDAPKMPEFPPDDEFFARALELLTLTLAQHSNEIAPAYSAEDVERNMESGLASAVLTIEDGRAVNGDMERLRAFYRDGVRAIALTWNSANCFGYPNSPDPEQMQLGLTEFGRGAIEEMNALGMLVDVSHLSDGGFDDVLEISKKPVIATHSNARALCNHPRNLTDEMIRKLAAGGGVSGINFMPDFLTEDGLGHSRIDDLCRHVLHFINVGGEDCVGLGTDFDGIHGKFEVGQPTQMHLLFDELQRRGLTERQMEKFTHGNVLRAMRDTL